MGKRLFSFVALLGALVLVGCNSRTAKVYSPDKKICVVVDDSTMSVKYNKKVVQTVRLGASNWIECSHIRETIEEKYEMVSGKRKECSYIYKVMTCSESGGRNLLIVYRMTVWHSAITMVRRMCHT